MIKKILIFILIFFSILPTLAFSQDSSKTRVAIITYIKGNVYVKKLKSELWIPAKVKMELASGDKVWVHQNSQAILQFSDRSTLKLGSNTQLDILNLDYDKDTKKEVSIFKLLIGKIWATIDRLLSQGERVEVQTPTAVAGVRGTEWIQEVLEDGTTKIWTLRGVVLFTAKDKTIEVKEGFKSIVKPGESPEEPSKITEIEKFDEEEKKEEKREEDKGEKERVTPSGAKSSQKGSIFANNSLDYGIFKKGDLTLAKLSFTPELALGPIRLGLDLSLYTNAEDVSYIQARVKYGELNLPWLGVRYGNIDNFNLGYGLIANRYSTYDMDGIVLRLENPKKGGIITLLPSPFNRDENITTTYALRLFYRPLNKLEVGLNGMFDLDSDISKRQGIVGIDAGYYFTRNLVVFATFAQRVIHDGISLEDSRVLSENGFALGLQMSVPIINSVLYLQALNYSDNFVPSYFNAYYEKNKILNLLPSIEESNNRISGAILGFDTNILNIISLGMRYESYNFKMPALYGQFNLKLGERLAISLSYEQDNISLPFQFINNNTISVLNMVYPIAQNVDAILTVERTYDLYGNPKDVYYLTTKINL
ncbi:FecR family protein [Dictyoglomus thermophilum]|uniref:FecR protein domain-containing protein n=1 Tax=Dictyoglomus thermophilum (strain ATCC 35947 / DSM 3960 / H-6-12) TaxID=309799 RepID=B5YEI5_DICT6|nr:FecR family protein [Dictyoglomus thermophilum]ACI19327.1 hypothetical protein DICTH_1094 [Dictyoglomus thermophilum H-6-12]